MSQGITTYDFVQQVYYAQEKVVLDFWPSDDKFKEVLFEANLILQELQGVEDWTWLRDRIVLGDCHYHHGEIPEYKLPPEVYKHSTLFHDSLKLYRETRHGLHEFDYLEVPFISTGANGWRKEREVNSYGRIHTWDKKLKAVRVGDVITFNRPLFPFESHRVAVIDVQKQIEQFHICDLDCNMITQIEYKEDGVWKTKDLLKPICEHDCETVWKTERIKDSNNNWQTIKHLVAVEPHIHLFEIPDPNYVVMATAARHAEGSPPAQARIQSLNDTAQRILSAMRQNDAAATDADYAEWDIPGYVEIV